MSKRADVVPERSTVGQGCQGDETQRTWGQKGPCAPQDVPALVMWQIACKVQVERGTLRATPQTYPRLAAGGNYVVSASEDRHASVWTFSDGRLLCTISDERRISGDFYAAVCNERLALICGKSLKIYDLSVHAGYKRAVSEGLGVSLRFLIDPAQFSQIAQEAAGKAGACITVLR